MDTNFSVGPEAVAAARNDGSRASSGIGTMHRTRLPARAHANPGTLPPQPPGRQPHYDAALTGPEHYPARLVRTWMDQGRDGIPPRAGPGRNFAEHRDPRSRDGPEDEAGLRRVLACHPAGQQRDPPRGIEGRRTPRGVVSQGALTCGDPAPVSPFSAGAGQRLPLRLTDTRSLPRRIGASPPPAR